MKVFIIYHKLYDLEGKDLTIGGIQTYILNLSKMLNEMNISCTIYQLGNNDWQKQHDGITIKAIKKLSTTNALNQSENILNNILKDYTKKDIIIWGTDSISIRNNTIKSISIQHGIGFDYIASSLKYLKILKILNIEYLYKILQRKKSINVFLKASNKVCVDYNYLNWIRTMLPREELSNIHVIPNFTHINNDISANQDVTSTVKILFARRFSEERGVLILIDVIDKILSKYQNVQFTIAGDGPYNKILNEKYSNNSNVIITKYEHSESLSIHSSHNIALIPTYGSEGTSLSLLEAMTSGCVPIATNVGGMTNIVLDGFNGYLVNPTEVEFVERISILIDDQEKRRELSKNAKQSVDNAFSYNTWKNKWIKVIDNVSKKQL